MLAPVVPPLPIVVSSVVDEKESTRALPYVQPALSPVPVSLSVFASYPALLQEVAPIHSYAPSSEAGRQLALALQQGASAPGHDSLVATALREAGAGASAVCYPALLRDVVRLLKARAPGLAHMKASPRYGDVAAMLLGLDKHRTEDYDRTISSAVSAASGLCLEFIYNGHCQHCQACHARGPFATAVLGADSNPSNSCYIAILLSLLDGKYPLPLVKTPQPFDRAHYPSFAQARVLCPRAIEPALAEFKARVLREVPADAPQPLQIHPALVVVKESDVLAALHELAQLGRPFPQPLHVRVGDPKSVLRILTHLDALNAHISAVALALGCATPLKKIKLRICTDLGEWNRLQPDATFAYPDTAAAVALLRAGYLMAKADAKNMFWSFPAAAAEQHLLGFRLDGKVYVAKMAQFGGKHYPLIANALMAELMLLLQHLGVPVVIYTDDVLTAGTATGVGPVSEQCLVRFEIAKAVISGSGLVLHPEKDEGPAAVLTFLGIRLDVPRRRLYLPQVKLRYYHHVVQGLLAHDPSYKDLEHALGLPGWAATVMTAGRVRLPRIRSCLQPWHQRRICLSSGAQEDLRWWEARLGAALHLPDGPWAPFWMSRVPVRARVIHDSSGDEAQGFGLLLDGRVYHGFWAVTGREHSSAYRELVPIYLAAVLVCTASPPREQVLVVTTDNESMAYAINKGSCRNADSDCRIPPGILRDKWLPHLYSYRRTTSNTHPVAPGIV